MKIKKYTARSMREALLQIKQELGEEAIILKSRRLPRKLFSTVPGDEIEVTAAIDDSAPASAPFMPLQITRGGPAAYSRPRPPAEKPVYEPRTSWADASPAAPAGGSNNDADRRSVLELKEDVAEIKSLLKRMLGAGPGSGDIDGFTGGWAVLYRRMVDAEVRPDIARDLLQGVRQRMPSAVVPREKELLEVLGERFPVAGPVQYGDDGPRIVALVGPTGAGKTTTLAKLAAHLVVDLRKSVSLITADTYRIAAIEQIRTFADIINIGLHVVFSPGEIGDALSACENDDVVLVDTAGRSRSNTQHMRELEQLLASLHPDEIHLVVSATTKDTDLAATIDRYRATGVNRLLFTKLDETGSLGNIFNAVAGSGVPVSYLTYGQTIPDDIELAQPGRFLKRLWEGRPA